MYQIELLNEKWHLTYGIWHMAYGTLHIGQITIDLFKDETEALRENE